jgi:hypothetical protein
MEKNGIWNPWFDTSVDKDGNSVPNYNYKFYYCRDAGAAGTNDDLPAIADSALILGANANFVCSEGGAACASQGAVCGPTSNGICVWSVLKESYFFHEAIPQTGEITSVTDTGVSGQVQINWYSPVDLVSSYKIYYGPSSGNSSSFVLTLTPLDACTEQADNKKLLCSYRISDLIDGQKYNFKVSTVSDKNTESLLSGGKEVTPTDKTLPLVPKVAKAEFSGDKVKISWLANSDDTVFYRVYHGLSSGRYGESFDTTNKTAFLDFNKSSYSAGDHFFGVSAVDKSGNESPKSNEAKITICAPGFYNINNGSSYCMVCDINFYCTGADNKTTCPDNTKSAAGSKAVTDCK